jgi:hypothetical protein
MQRDVILNIIERGFLNLSDNLEKFWPAKRGILNGKEAKYINIFSQNNIAPDTIKKKVMQSKFSGI